MTQAQSGFYNEKVGMDLVPIYTGKMQDHMEFKKTFKLFRTQHEKMDICKRASIVFCDYVGKVWKLLILFADPEYSLIVLQDDLVEIEMNRCDEERSNCDYRNV